MTEPQDQHDKQDENNSSENESQASNTEQQEPTTKPPVERGRTFGASGHEKRG